MNTEKLNLGILNKCVNYHANNQLSRCDIPDDISQMLVAAYQFEKTLLVKNNDPSVVTTTSVIASIDGEPTLANRQKLIDIIVSKILYHIIHLYVNSDPNLGITIDPDCMIIPVVDGGVKFNVEEGVCWGRIELGIVFLVRDDKS